MTHHALRNDLSFCRVGDQLVFLDINNDRYFCLPQAMEEALAAYLEGEGRSDLDISGLITRNILVDHKDSKIGSPTSIQPAARSAMEAPTSAEELRPSELLEVLAIVLHTQLQLKASPLRDVLEDLTANRCIQTAQAAPPTALVECRLTDAAAVYRRARLYVPVEMRCLLDSIAMARFLRRRELDVHVVFGVALDPFSAHCWVQAADLVLNDTVGNVSSHTPIRIV